MSTDGEIYDTVLIRDTCGNSRTKIKNYFYHNVYDKNNFKYNSDYDELMLLDVLEGSKTQLEYLKRFIPFLIIIAFGALSWIIWIVICACFGKPKGCLKRYSKSNKSTRRICFYIYYGFISIILILIVISLIYLILSRSDLNGTICTLSMLRYEMMYGESLLAKEDFKKPFWYGITTLSDNIQNVENFLGNLYSKCNIINTPPLQKVSNKNDFDNFDEYIKRELETFFTTYKTKTISGTNPKDTHQVIIPLYISNLGYKENNETYTGRILYDYQIHYEYLINTIINPIIGICSEITSSANYFDDLIDALNNFKDIISTLEDSMNIITNYITSYLSKYLVNLKSFYFIFFFLFLILMGTTITVLSILFGIYYFKPISPLYSSIKSMLYLTNFLMIFCLIFSGITGVFSIYFANASDIIDCTYSSNNIGSDNPRIISRETDSSILTRCIRGDGNLLEEFSNENVRKSILTLKKINSIYTAIIDADKRINTELSVFLGITLGLSEPILLEE